MKKRSGSKSKSAVPQVDPFLEGMMSKLMDRLSALERKMDAVAAAVSSRPAGGSESRGSFQDQNLQAKERVARRERVMFEAICADCNVPCEVPFRPAEGRAIYCKECFSKRRSGGQGRVNTPSVSPSAVSTATLAVKTKASSPQTAAPVRSAAGKAKKKQPAKKSKK